MMRSRSREDLRASSAWRTAPRWSVVVFLLAVFFVFASFGFVSDCMGMGRQPALRFAISAVLIGLFATCYAFAGITLRRRFWIPFVPLFILQNVCMTILHNWLPDASPLSHLDSAQLTRLHDRLIFDGVGAIVSVVLGYVGFVVVSMAEGRRRLRLEHDKAALVTELTAAREIQRLMVPEELPSAPGYAIESIYRPAAQVGGDFFQLIPLDGGQTIIVVGDVSGKGVSAAMIVSMLIGMLQTICRVSQDPAQILAELNSMLFERKHGGFVTCLAARLDPSGRIMLANAGHLPPYLDGSLLDIAGSLPLGMIEHLECSVKLFTVAERDRLLFLSDGVTEATDKDGNLFGFERVLELIRTRPSAADIANAAQAFGQEDDISVIAVTRAAVTEPALA